GEVLLDLARFYMWAIELADVRAVENCRTRRDRLQERFDGFDQFTVEHTGFARRGVHVVGENVPPGEHQVIEAGKRDEVLDLRRASLGALPQADGAHLGDRANRLRQATPYRLHARDERRRHGSHTRHHHAQLADGRRDTVR